MFGLRNWHVLGWCGTSRWNGISTKTDTLVFNFSSDGNRFEEINLFTEDKSDESVSTSTLKHSSFEAEYFWKNGLLRIPHLSTSWTRFTCAQDYS